MVTCRGEAGVGVQKVMSKRFLRFVPKEEESHEIGETPPDQTQKKTKDGDLTKSLLNYFFLF